jgi:hypothetical protein
MKLEQVALFAEDEMNPWAEHWQNMPQYVVEDLTPKFQVIVSFSCEADVADFGALIGQPVKANTNARQVQPMWFPSHERGVLVNKRYIGR